MINLNEQVLEEIAKRISSNSVVALGNGQGMMNVVKMLPDMENMLKGVITCSSSFENKLKAAGLSVLEPNEVSVIDLYVDTADEATKDFILNKKKDLRFTRAKIMAYQSREFICVVEKSDYKDVLKNTTVLVETLPYTRSLVSKKIKSLNALVHWHKDLLTENGNFILEVHNLDLKEPWEIEDTLDLIPGVVSSSIFASVIPDVLIIADSLHAESILQNDKHELATVH